MFFNLMQMTADDKAAQATLRFEQPPYREKRNGQLRRASVTFPATGC